MLGRGTRVPVFSPVPTGRKSEVLSPVLSVFGETPLVIFLIREMRITCLAPFRALTGVSVGKGDYCYFFHLLRQVGRCRSCPPFFQFLARFCDCCLSPRETNHDLSRLLSSICLRECWKGGRRKRISSPASTGRKMWVLSPVLSVFGETPLVIFLIREMRITCLASFRALTGVSVGKGDCCGFFSTCFDRWKDVGCVPCSFSFWRDFVIAVSLHERRTMICLASFRAFALSECWEGGTI